MLVRAVDPIGAAQHSTSEVGSSEFSHDFSLSRVPLLSIFGVETRLDNSFLQDAFNHSFKAAERLYLRKHVAGDCLGSLPSST